MEDDPYKIPNYTEKLTLTAKMLTGACEQLIAKLEASRKRKLPSIPIVFTDDMPEGFMIGIDYASLTGDFCYQVVRLKEKD